MWMCYVSEIEVVDLKSGVQNLRQTFENLAWDADHEAMYGAIRICASYTNNQICLHAFISLLKEVNLDRYLYRIKKYIPKVLYQFDEDSTSNDQNGKLSKDDDDIDDDDDADITTPTKKFKIKEEPKFSDDGDSDDGKKKN
uniref:Uncharacterized protein LOC114336799 isoform X2 n=1 Tax=Diabrotica virgifera virgifera TaxID=50390 RepID=A0A6P7GGA1_DIAVI